MAYLVILLAGFGGGVVRGLVGFVKHQFSYKDVGFKWGYFLGMMSLSGVIGFVVTLAVNELSRSALGAGSIAPALAIIVGYAGGDLLENLYKIIAARVSADK